MSDTSEPQGLYLTPFHETVPCRLVPLPDTDPGDPPHPLLTCVPVRDEIRRCDLLLLSVDPDAHRRPQDRAKAYTALDNEIAAGTRIARGTRGAHPRELSRLVGHHDDPERPFALLEPPRGIPLSALSTRRRLFEEERLLFRDGLLRALTILDSCGVVHRDITPDTVYWDERDGTLQIRGFTEATVAGTPRTAVGTAPWSSHEQREGTGRCDPRDDLWSAGLVLFQALTGYDAAGHGVLPLQDHPDLEPLLLPVLVRAAEERTTADALFTRTTGEPPPLTGGVDGHLAPGRARFLRDRAHKREVLGLPPDEAEERPGPAPTEPATDSDPPPEYTTVTGPATPATARSWGRILLLLAALTAATVALFIYLG
ncbi:hypothetical protein [Nocardiopsis sp. CC223A]|uniref:protein kinase domain-containing protein n=1 Tax=Nocardiopsis sp. CC223A TaxID=3044051 RepID=UPI00278C8278|nr:hypothetical protein [Nocardiopsis sp. CC223A]